MDLVVTGRAIMALPMRSGVSQRGTEWKSREYIIQTEERYPRKVLFNVFGEEKINEFAIHSGDLVEAHLEIECREFNGKYFNNVSAWKVVHVDPNAVQPQQQQAQPAPPTNSQGYNQSNQGTPVSSNQPASDDIF